MLYRGVVYLFLSGEVLTVLLWIICKQVLLYLPKYTQEFLYKDFSKFFKFLDLKFYLLYSQCFYNIYITLLLTVAF